MFMTYERAERQSITCLKDKFSIGVGLQQGFSTRPTFTYLVMDVVTHKMRGQ